MTTAELGVKVLATIQNLISEIDKPTHHGSIRKYQHRQSLGEVEEQFDRNQVYSKMSYNFRKKHTEVNTILKDRVYDDQKYYQKFKVTNKTTLKILQNKNIKPIHERAHEILAKKNNYIRYKQQLLQDQEKESMRPIHHSIDDLAARKYSQSELESYRYEIEVRNKERIKKRNMSKLHLVKKQELKIPTVNSFSRSLSSKRNVKKNYSQNVFQRMMQYNFERSTKKIQLMEARRKQEGNFQPVLCSKSMYIAQKITKKGEKNQHSFHHHSHCQLHSPKIDKIALKFTPKLTKKLAQYEKIEKSNEKSVNKSNTKQKAKSTNKIDKQISSNKLKKQTPLKQTKVNSTTNFTIKFKEILKKQKIKDQNKQNRNTSKTKIKQQERKKR